MTKLYVFQAMLLTILALSESCMKKEHVEHAVPVNFVVLLDLSDRIIENGVIQSDKELLLTAFDIFEKQVRYANITINSKDKFSIKVMPQSGSNYNLNRLENLLTLDMNRIDIAEKNKKLIHFKNSLNILIDSLYFYAYRGNNTFDYPGCDIWKYFNEQLEHDLDTSFNNIVIVLTDGYFDFENYEHTLQKNNLFTSSSFYNKLNGPDWKSLVIRNHYGIIPISFKASFSCIAAGINPKNNSLTEQEKLIYFWSEWMKNSHVNSFYSIPFSVPEKMKNLLYNHLNALL